MGGLLHLPVPIWLCPTLLFFFFALLGCCRSQAGDLSTIVIKGNKFFTESDGSQFFIRGVVYTPEQSAQNSVTGIDEQPQDILEDDNNACTRDIPILQKLGTNVVSVAALDPSNTHAQCMEEFQQSGMYVIIDLSGGTQQIGSNPPAWTTDVFQAFTTLIDEFQQFDNVLAFFVASQVYSGLHGQNDTANLAYVRAASRDLRQYMIEKQYRSIPFGYSAAGITDGQVQLANYLTTNDGNSSVDFIGLAQYSWCGESSLTESGYSVLVENYQDFASPLMFSEYGCNIISPRKFTEVAAIYSSEMTDVFSGGVVFEYFNAANNFGLISVDSGNVKTNKDYENLSSQQAKATPAGVSSQSYTPSTTVPTTYPTTDSSFHAIPTLPPRPYEPLCDCMMSSLSCTLADQNADDATLTSLFDQVCEDPTICRGIEANATLGNFGAYSMCTTVQQASWVLNAYSNANSDCLGALGGTAAKPAEANDTCSHLLAQAGPAGTATVTSYPTSTNSNNAGASQSRGTSASSATSSSTSSSGGLSTGAKAGVGVGVVLVVLILLAILAFFIFRQRRRRARQAEPQNSEKDGWGKTELPADGIRQDRKTGPEAHLAGGTARSEMPATQAPVELEAEDVRPPGQTARPGGMGELPS